MNRQVTGWPGDEGGGLEGQVRPGECHGAQESECHGAQEREGAAALILQRPGWPEKYPWGLVTGTLASLEGACPWGVG